jgi:hypothetical protein
VRVGFSNWNISATSRARGFVAFILSASFDRVAISVFRAVKRNTATGRLASRYRPGRTGENCVCVSATSPRAEIEPGTYSYEDRGYSARYVPPDPSAGRTRRRDEMVEARFARFASEVSSTSSSPSFSHPPCASREDSTVARPSTRTAANVCAAGACVCVPGRRCHCAKSPRYVRPSVPAPMPPSGAPAASPSSTHRPRHRGGPRETGGSPMGWLHATASGTPESSSGEGGGATATPTRSASASARSAARRAIAAAPGRSDEGSL